MNRTQALRDILAQNPADSFARYGLAMALATEDRTEDALTEYNTVIEHAPDYVPAYQMSAQLLLRLGRPSEAKSHLERGLEAAARTGNTHATAEMQAMLDDLDP